MRKVPLYFKTFLVIVGLAGLQLQPLVRAAEVQRFAGFMPCADCPAIRVELSLFSEKGEPTRYEQRLTYVDTRDGDRTFPSAGRWKVVDSGKVIELTANEGGEQQWLRKAGDRELRALDRERREIDSPIPQVLLRSERRFVAAPITVTPEQAGAAVTLQRGQEIAVRLPSTPGTGYRWTMKFDDKSPLLPLAKPKYERPKQELPGSAGTEVWRFAPYASGATTLSFEYRRPWEKDAAAARSVSFPVTVR